MNIICTEQWPGFWLAVDDDNYDGAPDSRTRHMIGQGKTREEAIADLQTKLEEWGCLEQIGGN